MWYRSEPKERAKVVLNRNYWKAVLVALILAIITGSGSGAGGSSTSHNNQTNSPSNYESIFDSIRDFHLDSTELMIMTSVIISILVIALIIFAISLVLSIVVFNPLQVGAQRFFITCRNENASLNELTYAFSHSYGNVVKTMFLRSLYVFLWSLLFVIPGIIKAYEYRMIPYILAENPNMDTKSVFARTKTMMDGEKWNAFVLDLSFIGWWILGALTCCILSVFYVNPYYYLTCTELYFTLKQKVDGASTTTNTYTSESFTQNPYV